MSDSTTSTPPARTVIIHVTTSLSPSHVPAQYHFTDSMVARMFASAAMRAANVYRIHATNEAGARLVGFDYMGQAERRRREAESANPAVTTPPPCGGGGRGGRITPSQDRQP